jgi:hypothetical protein
LSTSKPEPTPGPADPSGASDAALQLALTDAIEAYALRVREHGEIPPFPPNRQVMSTDVAITAAAIPKAAEVYSFEIAAMFNI